MNLSLSYGPISLEMHNLHNFTIIMTIMTKNYNSYFNVDLSFKSRTRHGKHVNSHPPGGVDLC